MKLLELKITLLDVQPPVWRKMLVSPELTLGRLHDILQLVMGWKNAHLHRFRAGGDTYTDPEFELEGISRDERRVRIGDLFSGTGSQLLYEYDFGDGWQHEVRCEGWVESDVRSPYALCTAGVRACPPEDCGGPPGYADLLQAWSGNKSRRSQELRAWARGRFDPEIFSAEQASNALALLFLPGAYKKR